MKPLLLLGGGGFARETVELVRAINDRTPTWELQGILDDNPALLGTELLGVPVIGPAGLAAERPDAAVVACVASPDAPSRRLELVARLGLPAERYATLVHPMASVPGSATLGPGTVLHAGVVLTADVAVGAHVAVMPAVVLTHDDVIEDGVTFGAGVRLAGTVTVQRGAYLGAGSLIRERLTVGAGAVVGMGAVVTRSVPPGEVWAGVPARSLAAVGAAR